MSGALDKRVQDARLSLAQTKRIIARLASEIDGDVPVLDAFEETLSKLQHWMDNRALMDIIKPEVAEVELTLNDLCNEVMALRIRVETVYSNVQDGAVLRLMDRALNALEDAGDRLEEARDAQ